MPGSIGTDLLIGSQRARLLCRLLHPVHGIGVIRLAGQTFGQLILSLTIALSRGIG